MRIRNVIITLAAAVLAASCVKDETQDVSVYETLATAYETDDDGYYFELDNGQTLATTSYVNHNLVSDSDRVFITYSIDEKPISGYDHNVTLYSIDTVMTLKALIIDDITPDSLGTDDMGINDGYLTQKWLNLEVVMPGIYSEHSLCLVKSTAAADSESDMIDVELRHKLKGDRYGYLGKTVCFDISGLVEAYPDRQGINVRIKDMNNNGEEKTYQYLFQMPTEL